MTGPSSLAGGVFVVTTCHGTTVRWSRQSGRIFHSHRPGPDAADLLLYIPPGALGAGFLMARDPAGVPLLAEPGVPAGIVALRLQRTLGSSQAAFCDPFTGRYMCAGPALADAGESAIVVDRTDCGGWETFTLTPAGPALLPPTAFLAMAALARWAGQPITGPNVFAIIERGVPESEAAAFDAFCRLLPQDQLAWLAPTMLGRPVAVSNFAATFPQDVFAAKALPALHLWLATRPKLAEGHLSSGLDGLAVAGLDGRYVSFGHMCNAFARRAVPARHEVCILATARNEGPYLLEWIAYHRSIGVDGFFIYSNDNDDGSDALLSALAQGRAITWLRSEVRAGGSAQPKAYGHALGVLPDILDYRWCLIIDLDEFFAFDRDRFGSIKDYIAWQEARPVDAVALNWLVYGSGGEDRWRDAPLLSRFTRRLPWLDPHVKTLVRTNLVMQSRPHHPVADARQRLITRNAAGSVHVSANGESFSAEPEAKTAWINHYFLKSAEEFLWKFSRNRGDHALVQGFDPSLISQTFLDMFVSQHRSPNVTLDERILPCGAKQHDHLGQLRSLPGVAEAAQGIQRRYQEVIGQLKAAAASLPAFRQPGSAQAQLGQFLGL